MVFDRAARIRAHLASEFGPSRRDRYREIFEALRAELGYADYPGRLLGELISVDFPALPGTHHAGRTQQEAS